MLQNLDTAAICQLCSAIIPPKLPDALGMTDVFITANGHPCLLIAKPCHFVANGFQIIADLLSIDIKVDLPVVTRSHKRVFRLNYKWIMLKEMTDFYQ